jgi:hypothetical protein
MTFSSPIRQFFAALLKHENCTEQRSLTARCFRYTHRFFSTFPSSRYTKIITNFAIDVCSSNSTLVPNSLGQLPA